MQARQRAPKKRHDSGFPKDIQSLQQELRLERAARIAAENKVAALERELKGERAARQAAERRAEALEWRLEAAERELEKFRRGRSETEEFLQKTIRRLEKELAERDELLEKVNAQIVWFRENYFAGNRSERAGTEGMAAEEVRSEDNQEDSQSATAKTEAVATMAQSDPATGDTVKRNRGQQPGTKGPARSDRSQLRTETEYLDKEDCKCSTCGKLYRRLTVTKQSPLVELYTELVRILNERYTYVPDCDCAGNKPITADPPAKLFDRTEIGNTVWTYLIARKYLYGEPTERTLKWFSLRHLHLSKGTVTGGLKVINEKLEFLYQALKNHCRGADFWNGDETWWSLFGKRWWMWLVASKDTVVYLLDPSRSKKVPNDFFAGSKGVFMTDRLASYKGLPEDVRKAWCWVHQRRDFLNVFKGMPKLKEWAEAWLKRIATVFVLNHKRFKAWENDQQFGKDFDQAQKLVDEHVHGLKECFEHELKQSGLHKKYLWTTTGPKDCLETLCFCARMLMAVAHNGLASSRQRRSVSFKHG
jgi:transposase